VGVLRLPAPLGDELMATLRRLLTIRSRRGNPGTLLSLGDAAGSLLYLEAAMEPVSVVVALEVDDVVELHAALAEWLRERADLSTGPAHTLPTGSPLVGGILGRVMADAGRSRTVQLRTVHAPDQQERDQPAV
jgi:hypothetical protein